MEFNGDHRGLHSCATRCYYDLMEGNKDCAKKLGDSKNMSEMKKFYDDSVFPLMKHSVSKPKPGGNVV